MIRKILFFTALVLFVSCDSSSKKKTNNIPEKKYITAVDNTDDYNVAYTEDGHTIIYEQDSTRGYVVYYVKFENGAGKFGLKGIEQKIIRFEMDSTLTTLNSFVGVTGGAFCMPDSTPNYNVYCFDELLEGNDIIHTGIPVNDSQPENKTEENRVKDITKLLNVAYNIAVSVNSNKVRGWDNIVYALSSVTGFQNYEVIIGNTIYDERVKKRVPRIMTIDKELTRLNHFLREKQQTEHSIND